MGMKILVFSVILLAIAVGAFSLFLPRDQLIQLIRFRDFFEVALPIIAFGSLLKYLVTPSKNASGCQCSCQHCVGCQKK